MSKSAMIHNHAPVLKLVGYLCDNGLRVEYWRNDANMLDAVVAVAPDQ